MTRNVQNGPSERIAHHFRHLRGEEEQRLRRARRSEDGLARSAPSTNIARNAPGYATRMSRYTSPAGSIAAAGALRALVGRGAPRLDQHGAEHDREEDESA